MKIAILSVALLLFSAFVTGLVAGWLINLFFDKVLDPILTHFEL